MAFFAMGTSFTFSGFEGATLTRFESISSSNKSSNRNFSSGESLQICTIEDPYHHMDIKELLSLVWILDSPLSELFLQPSNQ